MLVSSCTSNVTPPREDPDYVLSKKGYLGSIKDKSDYESNLRIASVACKDAELRLGGFYKPYLQYNEIVRSTYINLDKNGVYGLRYAVNTREYIKGEIIQKIKNNPLIKTRNDLISAMKQEGLETIDEMTIFSNKEDYSLANFNSRGLLKLNIDDEFELDLAKDIKVEADGKIIVELGDNYCYDSDCQPVRKISSNDFKNQFLNPPGDFYDTIIDFEIIDDNNFSFYFGYGPNNYLKKIHKFLNNPRLYILYSDNAYKKIGTEFGEIWQAQKEGIIGSVNYVTIQDKYNGNKVSEPANNQDDYYYEIEDKQYSYSISLKPNEEDEHYTKAINNAKFRMSVLSSLLREDFLNLCNNMYSPHSQYKLKTDNLSRCDKTSTLNSDVTISENVYKAGQNYNDIVNSYSIKDDGVTAATEYFEEAKKELGTSFFKTPICFRFNLLNNAPEGTKSYVQAYYNWMKSSFEKVFGESVTLQIENKQAIDRYDLLPIYVLNNAYTDDYLVNVVKVIRVL